MNIQDYLPNNKYIKHYILLVERRLQTPSVAPYTEKHHILPRSLFPDFQNCPDNLVTLSLREHFIAHLLLWKGTGTKEMQSAFWCMSNITEYGKMKSKRYETLRSEIMLSFKGLISLSKNGKLKYVNESEVDRHISEGWIKGNLHIKDKVCINDGKQMLRVDETAVDAYLEQGWKLGLLLDSPMKGKVWMNKDGERKIVLESDVSEAISDGWELGRRFNTLQNGKNMHRSGTKKFVVNEEIDKHLKDGWKYGCGTRPSVGKVCMFKDGQIKYFQPDEVDEMISSGWKKGRK